MMETNIVQVTTFGEILTKYTPPEFWNPVFNDLKVFIDNNNQCWFIGSKVAERLGYTNPRKAIRDHVNPQYRIEWRFRNDSFRNPLGGNPNIILIHERGLYELIIKSHLDDVWQFQNWVFMVIENMRRYGMALSPQRMEEMLSPVCVLPEDMKNTILQMKQNEMNYKNTINTLQQDNTRLRNSNDGLWEDTQVISLVNLANKYSMSLDQFTQLLMNTGIMYYNNKEARYVIDKPDNDNIMNPLLTKDDVEYIENELRKYNIYKE